MDLYSDSTVFIYLIPLIIFFCVVLSNIKFKRFANPISIISVWWGGWLWITNFSLTELYIPTANTQLLIILMIISYTFGALVSHKNKDKKNSTLQETSLVFYTQFSSILRIAYPVLFILILPLFIKSISLLSSSVLESYRSEVFGSVGVQSVLYESVELATMYEMLVYSALLLCLIVSSVILFSFGNRLFFSLSIILTFLKSIMELGRTEIYSMFLLLILLGALFNRDIINKIDLKSRKKLAFFLLPLLLIIVSLVSVISLSRKTTGQGDSLFEVFYDFAIWYHTTGFILLDIQLSDPYSVLSENTTYGLSIFSGVEKILFLIITRFSNGFSGFLPMVTGGKEKLIDELNEFMSEFVRVGPSTMSNAYYTMVYNFYQDGRELGVFIASFGLGYVTSLFYQDWIKNNNFYSLIWLVLFLQLTLLSIFQYYFAALSSVIAIAYLFLIQTYYSKKMQLKEVN